MSILKTNIYFNLKLDYLIFKVQPEITRIETLLKIEASIEPVDAPIVKQFLNSLYYDSAQPAYFKKKCLDILAKFTYLEIFNPEGLIEKIKDISIYDDTSLIVTALRNAYRFYKFFDQAFYEWLDMMLFHNNAEVRSEAYHTKGRIFFYRSLANINFTEHLDALNIVIQCCAKSQIELENRVDAIMLENIAAALKGISTNLSDNEIDAFYKVAQSSLWKYIQFTGGSNEIIYFVNIINTLSNVKEIYFAKPQSWLEIRRELVDLFVEFHHVVVGVPPPPSSCGGA